MTRSEIFEVVKTQIYQIVSHLRGNELHETDNLTDLGADSLDIVEGRFWLDYRLCLFGPWIQAVITIGSGILNKKELYHYRDINLPKLSAALLGLECAGLLTGLGTN